MFKGYVFKNVNQCYNVLKISYLCGTMAFAIVI